MGDAARRDPRVRFQRNERNLGMSANFNALARAARGEFLVAIGDDDRLLPEFVSRLVGVMRPELGVAFSNHYLINAEGTRLEPESREYTRHYGRDTIPAGVLENADAAAWRQSIPMSASLLRTADLQRLRFREDLNTPDVEFFIRLALQGARFIFVPEYLMEYRIHLGAVTASGLWTEELVECLTPIEVKPEIEPYKRKLLIPMVVNAVSRCLQQGNMERARAFLRNKYYPRGRRVWWNGSRYPTSVTRAGAGGARRKRPRAALCSRQTFARFLREFACVGGISDLSSGSVASAWGAFPGERSHLVMARSLPIRQSS